MSSDVIEEAAKNWQPIQEQEDRSVEVVETVIDGELKEKLDEAFKKNVQNPIEVLE